MVTLLHSDWLICLAWPPHPQYHDGGSIHILFAMMIWEWNLLEIQWWTQIGHHIGNMGELRAKQ